MPYHNDRYHRSSTYPTSFHSRGSDRYEALSRNPGTFDEDRNSVRLRRLQLVACVALAFAVMTAGISLLSLITTLRTGGGGRGGNPSATSIVPSQLRTTDVATSPYPQMLPEQVADISSITATASVSSHSPEEHHNNNNEEVEYHHYEEAEDQTMPFPQQQQQEQVEDKPPACSAEENEMVRYQLPEAGCRTSGYLCSISFETACPLQSWLEDYYNLYADEESDGRPFVGISVGCNKAFNAIDTLRMASANPKFDKAEWHQAIYGTQEPSMDENHRVKNGACSQEDAPPFPLSTGRRQRAAEMHCIEPILPAADAVQAAAESLGWDKQQYNSNNDLEQSIVVSAVAIGREDGELSFPTKDVYPGDETMGMTACMPDPNASEEANQARMKELKCETVPVHNLSSYAQLHDSLHHRIHVLNIDTEGHDFDVMLGGKDVLERVEYLEFERHFKGPWNGQSLHDAIQMLEEFDFTCYFAGRGNLWRISGDGCFQEYFDVPCWSNVACANRRLVPTLANVMEQTYQKTLGLGKDFTPANMVQKGPKNQYSFR